MRPLVPDRAAYDALIDEIFERAQFTNEGPLADALAEELCIWLGVPRLQLVSSGAAALGLALDAVGLAPGAEVVTTPFTFAASAHAIALKGFRPVFADVDPDTLCLDPTSVDKVASGEAGGVLATHIFGGVCHVEDFATLGKARNLKIIYDGAHAFGTTIGGHSIFHWGDASALSFHATKIFHTVEGGAVATSNDVADEHVRIAKAHGIDGAEVPLIGPNAKMSELHAACGLTLLPHIHNEITARAALHAAYRQKLDGSGIRFLVPGDCTWNHAYCPILLRDENAVLRVQDALAAAGIGARRYFYPSLNTLPFYAGASCPVAEDAARRVLCLPFGGWLDADDIERVCTVVGDTVR